MIKTVITPWKIEVCAPDVTSVRAAVEAGAHRIELCSAFSEGGVTPSAGFVQMARKMTVLPIRMLIRPRSGDFYYGDEEVEMMRADIRMGIESGMDGFVLGALKPEGSVDTRVMSFLLEIVGDASWTFHRAFDFCNEPVKTLHQIIHLGADTLLTSGFAFSAAKGVKMLSKFVTIAAGNIDIMAGAGINVANIAGIAHATGCTSFHLSARSVSDNHLPEGAAPKMNAAVIQPDHYHRFTNPSILKACMDQLGDASTNLF